MLNFYNIENLVDYMFEIVNSDEPVSIVAKEDLAISVIKELLEYEHIRLEYADVNTYEYDREYLVTLSDDIDTDNWNISIEPIYNYEKEKYFGTDGYVLFHEDVNSKALIDMQNNKNIELSGHDFFVIGEAEADGDVDETNISPSDHTSLSPSTKEVYRVNGKEVDKDTYLKILDKINHEKNLFDNFFADDTLNYFRFLQELSNWRKFYW